MLGSASMMLAAFERPPIDWHAVAPELTLLAFGALLTVVDIVWLERGRAIVSALASFGLLASMVPVLTLAFGVMPGLIFDVTDPAVVGLLAAAGG